MIPVEHACYTVEPKSVEIILLHPEFTVAQKELQGFIPSIIEAAGSPRRMLTCLSLMKIWEPSRPIYITESLQFILHSVRMHYIHNHGNAIRMGCIHQLLKILRCPETGAQSKEIGDLISEGTIIRMLLKSHYLQRIIAHISHMRQYILCKIPERGNSQLLPCHTYMGLIDERILHLLRKFMFPLIWFLRSPYLCSKQICLFVLDTSCCICRQTLALSAIPFHIPFEQIAMFHTFQ